MDFLLTENTDDYFDNKEIIVDQNINQLELNRSLYWM